MCVGRLDPGEWWRNLFVSDSCPTIADVLFSSVPLLVGESKAPVPGVAW